ncbi:hypothetical protein HN789_05920 [archaeon]|nr:hypothetical protein [archaeon]
MVGYFEKWGTYLEKVNTPMRVRVSKSLKAYQKQSIDFEFQGPRANIWFKIPKKSVLEESYDNMIGKRSEIKPKKIKTKAARKKPKKRGIKVSKRKIPKKKAKPKITKKKVVSFSKPLSLSPSQQHLSSSIQEILSLDPSSFSKKYNIFQKDRNSIDEVCLTYVFMKGLLNLGVKPRTYIPRSELLKYYYFGDFQKTSQGVAQNLENALEKGLEYFSQRNIDFKPISKKEGLSYSLPTHLELDKAYFEINFLKDEAPKTRAMRMLEDFQIQSLPDNVLSILRKSRTKYEIAWELAHTYQRSKRVLGSLGRAIYNLKKEQKIRQEKGILYKR